MRTVTLQGSPTHCHLGRRSVKVTHCLLVILDFMVYHWVFHVFATIDSLPNDGGWRSASRYRDRTDKFRVGCVPELSRGQ